MTVAMTGLTALRLLFFREFLRVPIFIFSSYSLLLLYQFLIKIVYEVLIYNKKIENKFLLFNHVNVLMSGLTSKFVTSCQGITIDDIFSLDDTDCCFISL